MGIAVESGNVQQTERPLTVSPKSAGGLFEFGLPV
jgi:hypothetical protein